MKILHITESLDAGVENYLYLVTRGQVLAGHEVVLAHSLRGKKKIDQLDAQFSFLSKRVVVPMVTPVSLLQDLLGVGHLMQLMRHEDPDVIHLHSSKAGVLGRVAALLTGRRSRVFYSPHGFAFLRQDVSMFKQKLFLVFEQLAAKLGGTLVACSRSEAELAKDKVRHFRVQLVENGIDINELQISNGSLDLTLNVVSAGRVCYQKAPWRFIAVANACADLPVRFVWLGDGEMANLFKPALTSNLHLTGWLTRQELAQHLVRADVFLLPSLWEGMPLALIEAQVTGIPAVVSKVEGCQDVVLDGVTGFVCETDADLCARTRQLIQDASLRKRMGYDAALIASKRFSVTRVNDELLHLYFKKL